MPSDCVRESILLLELLKNCKNKTVFDEIIKKGGVTLLNCLTEIAHNILFGNIPISNKEKERIKSKKIVIRKLGDVHKSTIIKKKICIKNPELVKFLVVKSLPIIQAL